MASQLTPPTPKSAVPPVRSTSTPWITLRRIRKAFPGVQANDSVDLDLYVGEVHALLGENGAGKSTLMKVLYGYYKPDDGEVLMEGRPASIRSPADARRMRIGMVFQDFTLIPAMTVLENMALFLPDMGALFSPGQVARRIEEVSEQFQLHVDPWVRVGQLSVGEQQKVEVLKLLLGDARLLILDEPTRVLAPHEIDGLFRVFDSLRRERYAVVFITHKLREVLACADRVTVMRRGRVAGTLQRAQASEAKLVELMFGSYEPEAAPARAKQTGPESIALLVLRGVHTRSEGAATPLVDVHLEVRPGEIVGVSGVSGNGQKELGDLVLGLIQGVRGEKRLFGEEAMSWPVWRARQAGVAFIPESPLVMAAVPWMSVLENMALGDPSAYARQGGLSIDWQGVARELNETYGRLDLTPPPAGAPAGSLSGGNLQRLILARELARQPRLIVAFYPTRGLDVPSAAAAGNLLVASRNEGAGVLLFSEDLEELFALSDRLVVMHRGRVLGPFDPRRMTLAEIGHRMTGSEVGHAVAP